MKFQALLLISIITFSMAIHAAEPVCIQGTRDKNQIDSFLSKFKGKPPQDLASSYQAHTRAGNAIASLYSAAESNGNDGFERIRPLVSQLGVTKEAQDCIGDNRDQNINRLRRVVSLGEIPVVRKSCIRAAMLREHGSSEYMCTSSNAARESLGSPGENGSCLTEQMVDYTWWALHKAVFCLSDPAKPVDPMIIFLKMNNESTLHAQVVNEYTQNGKVKVGGVGIGQLTTAAIEQVNISHRLKKVLNSIDPNCKPFKQALKEKQPESAKVNQCNWIEPNDGLARNLMYSVAYYIETRDNLLNSYRGVKSASINAALEKAGIEDSRFYNYAALAAYGPKGGNVQPDLIEALRASGNNYKRFKEEVRKRVTYVANISDKADEAVQGAENGITSVSDCYDPMTMGN